MYFVDGRLGLAESIRRLMIARLPGQGSDVSRECTGASALTLAARRQGNPFIDVLQIPSFTPYVVLLGDIASPGSLRLWFVHKWPAPDCTFAPRLEKQGPRIRDTVQHWTAASSR